MSRNSRPERIDPKDERARLRLRFICLYVQDEEFQRALEELAQTEGDVEAFCERWGLTFDDCASAAAVEAWCEVRRSNPDFPYYDLLSCYSWSGFVPRNYSLIPIKFIWDPAQESRADAEKRLPSSSEGVMQAPIDEIDSAYRCFNKPPRQRSPMLFKHLGWLFERQRHGRTIEDIAKDDPMVGRDAVRHAYQRLAKKMRLTLRRRLQGAGSKPAEHVVADKLVTQKGPTLSA